MKKNVMPFPSQYKKKLLSGKKNITVRVGKEMGKYKKGREYDAQSYSGKDWGFKVRINSVITTKFENLHKHVPKQALKSKDFKNLKPKDKVQIIHIKPLIDLSKKDKTMKELEKAAGLIALPPETKQVWEWVKKTYARWTLNDILKPRITQRQYKEIEKQIDDLDSKLYEAISKVYDAKTVEEEYKILDNIGLNRNLEIPIISDASPGLVYYIRNLYIVHDTTIPIKGDKSFQRIWTLVDSSNSTYNETEPAITLLDAFKIMLKKIHEFSEHGEPLWDEDLPDYIMMKRQALQDSENKKTTVGYATTEIVIDRSAWKIYNIPENLIPINIKIELRKQTEGFPLGQWDEHGPTLRVFVPEASLTPDSITEYNDFKEKLESTVEHEMRHLVETMLDWSKGLGSEIFVKLEKEIAAATTEKERKILKEKWWKLLLKGAPHGGQPKHRTPGYDPHGYDPRIVKKWEETNLTPEKTTQKWKELEEKRLPHPLRDIEFHTVLGDAVREWKSRFSQEFPESVRNEAIKAFIASLPYYNQTGQNKPFSVQLEDIQSKRVWPHFFFVFLRNKANEELTTTNKPGPWVKRYRDAVNKFITEIT